MARFEIRDPCARPGEDCPPHELVTITFESPDGKTRHSNVQPLTDDELMALAQVAFTRVVSLPNARELIMRFLLEDGVSP